MFILWLRFQVLINKLSRSSLLTKPLNNHRSPMLTLALKHCFRGPKLMQHSHMCPLADWEHWWIFCSSWSTRGTFGEHSVSWGSPSPVLMLVRGARPLCSRLKAQVNNGKRRAKLKAPVCSSKSCTPGVAFSTDWDRQWSQLESKAPDKPLCSFYRPTLICKTFFFPNKEKKLKLQDRMKNKPEAEKKKKNKGHSQRGRGARPADRHFWQTEGKHGKWNSSQRKKLKVKLAISL